MAKSIDDRGRGTRLARRDEGAYCWYVTDEQRSQPGCIGRESDRLSHSRALGLYRIALALTWILFLVVGARPARATSEPVPPQEEASVAGVIEITVVGGADMRSRARDALAAHSVAPKILRWRAAEHWDPLELMSGGSDPDVRLRCWLVLSDPDHARLYFADHAAKRFLIRDLELNGHMDELDREALSQALELSIRALLDDREAGLDREQARSLLAPELPSSPPPHLKRAPASVAPQLTRSGFAAHIGWNIDYHSREFGFVQGPALALRYERTAQHFRTSFWVRSQYQLQKTFASSLVGLELRALTFRSGFELTAPLPSSAWFAGGSLGGGVEIAHFAPLLVQADSSVELTSARSNAVPVVSGALLIGNEISSHVRLTVALLATLPLLTLHYDLDVGGTRERVVDPWLVRPGLALEIGLH